MGTQEIGQNLDIATEAFKSGAEAFVTAGGQYEDAAKEVIAVNDALLELSKRIDAINTAEPSETALQGFKSVHKGEQALAAATGEIAGGSLLPPLEAAREMLTDEFMRVSNIPALEARDETVTVLQTFGALRSRLHTLATHFRGSQVAAEVTTGGIEGHIIEPINTYRQGQQ